jgi:hypothetical protein
MIPAVPYQVGARTSGFNLNSLQRDSNCVLIQDPSAIWGGSDHLPRRNLLTYSEDFSNAAWTKTVSTATATGFLESAGGGTHFLGQTSAGSAVVAGRLVTLKARIAGVGRDWAAFAITAGTGFADARYLRYVNLTTGSLGQLVSSGVSNVSVSASLVQSGTVDVTITCSFDAANASGGCIFYGATADGTASYTGDVAKGLNISNCGIYLASTTDQSYQLITDWTTEQYAWAATKNVPWLRRNLINGTEIGSTVTQGTAASGLADPLGGTSAYTYTENTASSTHNLVASSLMPGTGKVYFSGYFKAISGESRVEVLFTGGTSQSVNVIIDLTDLSIKYTNVVGLSTFSISDAGAGWSFIQASVTHSVGAAPTLRISTAHSNTPNQVHTGTSSVYGVFKPNLTAGVVADYQKVDASWAATYTALALAAGYPISLYSDRAGTTATYGPDDPVGVLLDQSEGLALGQELVTNGDFSNGTTGWTRAGGTSLTETGGVATLTFASLTYVYQAITTVVGKTYRYSANLTAISSTTTLVRIEKGDASNGVGNNVLNSSLNIGRRDLVFTATATTSYILVTTNTSTAGSTISFDNISVREIPGYHATAPSVAGSPTLRLDGNGRFYLDRDTTDDNLPITWPTVLSESQLGPELVTNGTFTTDTTGWTATNGEIAAVSGEMSVGLAGSAGRAVQGITCSIGAVYKISFSSSLLNGGIFRFGVDSTGATGSAYSAAIASTGTTTLLLVSTATTMYITFGSPAGPLKVDNVSVKQVTGTNVIYTATGDYTTKDSGLILSGATDYKFPQRPSGDYGRIVMAAESKYDAKIIKYLDAKRGRSYQLGPELVSNGTNLVNTIGWSAGNAATLSAVDGKLSIYKTSTSWATTSVATVVGKKYFCSCYAISPTAPLFFRKSDDTGTSSNVVGISSFTGGVVPSFEFIATATTSYITVQNNNGAAYPTTYWNNISVREVIVP